MRGQGGESECAFHGRISSIYVIAAQSPHTVVFAVVHTLYAIPIASRVIRSLQPYLFLFIVLRPHLCLLLPPLPRSLARSSAVRHATYSYYCASSDVVIVSTFSKKTPTSAGGASTLHHEGSEFPAVESFKYALMGVA